MTQVSYPLLQTVNTPADLRRIPRSQLETLASELRAYLLASVSKTGGHLSSNLGTVELTVALHYVFNTPHDRLVWDVGHQTYPHKILTGRRERMNTLRQFGGLSGFPQRTESEFDAFGTAGEDSPWKKIFLVSRRRCTAHTPSCLGRCRRGENQSIVLSSRFSINIFSCFFLVS